MLLCFYAFHEDDQSFQLIASGVRGKEVREEKARKRKLEERADETSASEKENHFKLWDGKINSGEVLTPLLTRLAMGGTETRPVNRLQPFVENQFSELDGTTLLFRTMTAILSISTLKPNGRHPLVPKREELFVPSAPSLYLYTRDGSHIGTAWVYSEEMYKRMISSTSKCENISEVEVAVVAGPVRADWRTRKECPSERQLMDELVEAGVNARDIIAKHMTRGLYHSETSRIFLDLVEKQHPRTYAIVPIEHLKLDDEFWKVLEERVQEMGFLGHSKGALEAFRETLMKTNSYTRIDLSVRYFRVSLVGNLGGEMLSGTGKAAEVFGTGEICEDALGLIDGLSFEMCFILHLWHYTIA